MTAFTVRLPDEQTARLDQLAGKLDRSRASLAARAIEEFLDREAWQLAEIEAGLAEADRGELASRSEVASVVARYARSGA